MENTFDFAVVGGGVVGAATAYKLSRKYPDASIILLEKESSPAAHQTGHNSGVIHSGIYYKPGSFKAKNCRSGRLQLVQFAKEHGLSIDVCGKLILATSEEEYNRLDLIYERGVENGIEGISKVDRAQIVDLEPEAAGDKAIHVPCTGIIDYVQLTNKLMELFLERKSNKVLYNQEVKGIRSMADGVVISTLSKDQFTSTKAVFCGGLQADRLARLEGLPLDARIVAFRGDYYKLTEQAKHKVQNLIYPVPDLKFPFLGVHLTRMIDGSVECGPNAVFNMHREGYSRTAFNFSDTMNALSFSGTWKLFSKHWKNGLEEQRRAFSKTRFLKALQELVPSLTINDIQPARCGIRAQALGKDGSLIDDFYFVEGDHTLHVINAPSPAATACMSIADEILLRI